jgi:uncharacterized phage protein gp47/JayE
MPFTKPTLTQIFDRMKSDLQGKLTEAGTWLRNSLMEIFIKVIAGSHYLMYDFLDWCKKQLFITTAEAEYLELQGAEYGILRNYGVKAAGSVTLTGEAGSVVPAGTKLQSALGEIYTVDSEGTFTSTTLVASITAEAVGSDYNQIAASTLSFISPIAGIQTDAIVTTGGIVGGTDIESDDAYRDRILTRKKEPPHGGTLADYINWAKEVTGVTRAWAFAQLYGPGTIGVAFVRDGDTPIIPTPADIATVRAYIVGHVDPATGKTIGCPVTAEPGLIMIDLEALTVDFAIKTTPFNSSVTASMQAKLEELMFERGGPGEEITISQMYEAITAAVGEVASVITSPAANVVANYKQIPILGTVTIEELV